MSQMGGPNKIGELHVDITARGATQTAEQLKQVKVAGEQAATATGNLSSQIKGATQPLRQFQQAIRGVVMSFFGWFAVIGTVVAALGGLIAAATRAGNAVSGMSKAVKENEKTLADTAKVLEGVGKEIKAAGIFDPDRVNETVDSVTRLNSEIAALDVAAGKTPLLVKLFGPVGGAVSKSVDARRAAAKAEREEAQKLLDVQLETAKSKAAELVIVKEIRDTTENMGEVFAPMVEERKRKLEEYRQQEERITDLMRKRDAENLAALHKRLEDERKGRDETQQQITKMLDLQSEMYATQRRELEQQMRQTRLGVQQMVVLLHQIKNSVRD